MVHLRLTHACESGDHEMCSGGEGSPDTFGGWKCTCHCHHKNVPYEETMSAKIAAHQFRDVKHWNFNRKPS